MAAFGLFYRRKSKFVLKRRLLVKEGKAILSIMMLPLDLNTPFPVHHSLTDSYLQFYVLKCSEKCFSTKDWIINEDVA